MAYAGAPRLIVDVDHGTLQGWPVLRIWAGAIYLRIPSELQRPIDGGCHCTHCLAHPKEAPAWDTFGVPLEQGKASWVLHAPEWRSSDKVSA